MYEIFTKPNCQYCHKAKDLLAKYKLDYVEHIVGVDLTLEELKERFPDAKKVPIILNDGREIGTFEDLQDRLNPLVQIVTGETEENVNVSTDSN